MRLELKIPDAFFVVIKKIFQEQTNVI